MVQCRVGRHFDLTRPPLPAQARMYSSKSTRLEHPPTCTIYTSVALQRFDFLGTTATLTVRPRGCQPSNVCSLGLISADLMKTASHVTLRWFLVTKQNWFERKRISVAPAALHETSDCTIAWKMTELQLQLLYWLLPVQLTTQIAVLYPQTCGRETEKQTCVSHERDRHDNATIAHRTRTYQSWRGTTVPGKLATDM